MNFAERIIEFNHQLAYTGKLPEDFRVLNPFRDNPETVQVMEQFYRKYYNDNLERRLIVGINPGRLGAGVTGVPFTDTKRLKDVCGIEMESAYTHEISSVFVYDMIMGYGGAAGFYKDFYINSPFALAIVRRQKDGSWTNANYYDSKELFNYLETYMIETLRRHVALGIDVSKVFVLGKRNADFIVKMNKKANLFNEMVVLEHPRYIQQYKSKEKQLYIDKYLLAFSEQLKQ